MTQIGENLVKLILRDKEYEVKHGMMLLDALKKCNIVPESVIATRDGEMILDDEILMDGEVVKLVAVISGGTVSLREANDTCTARKCWCSGRRSNLRANQEIASG